jgi:lipopolysaccharide/colanic/teichoic acid biosynthesis glycosyltransferase
LDVLLALVLLAVSLPVLLVAALAIRLTSRGPVLYWQTRTGRSGKPYTIYKLRTMSHCCEATTGPRWSTPGDTRITLVGRFLRRTHLDELPQLWNVLRGDMRLVGPRPERPEFVVELQRVLPDYGKRLAVRPGLTGLAQIQLPADTDLASVARKLRCDIHYVEHGGLWLDFRILVGTAFKVVGLPVGFTVFVLRLPRFGPSGCTAETGRGQAAAPANSPPFLQPALSEVS